jgi:benzodiazapine receptor
MKAKEIIRFIVSIVICQSAGLIGSLFTTPSIPTWYAGLQKPPFNPPNVVFAPVWTVLFFLMGVSLFLVWRFGFEKRVVKVSLILFFSQLVLNILWSVLFFGLKQPMLAFIEIVILWIFILLTIIYFFKVSRTASILMIPYILWVSFASILNFFIWRLNP